MSYFGGASRMAGDPGLFDTLGRIGGAIFGASPLGRAVDIFRGSRPTQFQQPTPRATLSTFQPPTGTIGRVNGGGAAAQVGAARFDVNGRPMRKRRRMNVGNAKALRRAIRRTDGFVTLARGALKNTGFKIVSKSSGKVSRATMDKAVAAAHHQK